MLHKFEIPKEPYYPFDSFLVPIRFTYGSIVSVVGVPKSGKTTYALLEVLHAQSKGECLVMYNESSRSKYMRIVKKLSDDSGIPVSDNVVFSDMAGTVLQTANYDGIQKFVSMVFKDIEAFMASAKKPQVIVIDSLSKFCRTYSAQSFYFAQEFNKQMEALMTKYKKYPLVLEINQKSGGHWERDDESVLGGYGIVHEMDCSLIFRLHYIDTPFWEIPVGSLVHTVQQTDLRFADVDTTEYVTIMQNGRIVIDKPLSLLRKVSLKQQVATQ